MSDEVDLFAAPSEGVHLHADDVDAAVRALAALVLWDRDGAAARALRALAREGVLRRRFHCALARTCAAAPESGDVRLSWAHGLVVDHEDRRELLACLDRSALDVSRLVAMARAAHGRIVVERLLVDAASVASSGEGADVRRIRLALETALAREVPRAAA